MTTSEFENKLKNPESSILDFKRSQYDILNDSGDINTAKFVKDIISFCNTIRTETAYIIIGVDLAEDGTKDLIGIDKHIDDAVFQEKIKNKVIPVPIFNYDTIDYQGKIFGIIEIPIKKYPEPILGVKKMKGIEPGKVYFRRGSSNSEALGRDTIMIYKWLESLPADIEEESLLNEISRIMLKITSNSSTLSECIAESLHLAKKYKLSKLKEFCDGELSGWYDKLENLDVENVLAYRMNKVIMSPHTIELNPHHSFNSDQMINELRKMNGFYENVMLFPHSISQLESILKRISVKAANTIVSLSSAADKILGNSKLKGQKIMTYANLSNFDNVYNGIKQKLINILIEINE